ncbi:hypothetical protein ACFOY2_06370 [Nonomuraea purpurea]|uniref:Uncharacterized protein n=1 Tax=Nonomuraea purpurea TaxID=1849276 RepID=A0ABV8G3A5_9ACTN
MPRRKGATAAGQFPHRTHRREEHPQERRLVDTGFLPTQPSRPGARGSTEIPYGATGCARERDPGRHAAVLDAFLEEVRLAGVERGDFSTAT